MKRTPVNPWEWNIKFGFHQAELIEGSTRTLVCAGQTSVDDQGEVVFPGDMAAQIGQIVDNMEAVLAKAGMTLSDVVRLNMYTTDVELFLQNVGVLAKRLEAAGIAPPGSLLAVSGFAFPGLVVELEATAMA